ncbi:MAG: hypothetical protein HY260_08950 [Chloroflexi bacterium]|nr:hypothetical protein [Chloroflexota bacterium]
MSDLEDFVLDFIRAAGGVVEPPAYGMYEALLPDDVAARLGVAPLQRFAFADRAVEHAAGAADDRSPQPNSLTWLTYGHPLVEAMIAETRERPACAQFYVADVRLDKHGLAALARNAVSFPNATLVEVPRALETPMLFRYVRFNFRAALVSDEKREYLVSALMDAQTGGVLNELPASEAYRLTDRRAFTHLPLAPGLWTEAADPLAAAPLRGLLDRAAQVASDSLAAPTATLQARAARHLELDRARLDEYYAGIESDLERRLARSDDGTRRKSLEEKLTAARADRAAKTADAEAKYRVRAELDLINVAVIAQPKIALQVRIENRHAAVTRTAVWDPVRHALEPFVCDVCHRPSSSLILCANNHLAHTDCLAPQCVDCKRAYCRNCADQLTACVVCDRPVCDKSLTRCRDCGRGTCREHAGLCHAAEGAPAKLAPEGQRRIEEINGLSALGPLAPETAKKPEPPPSPPAARPSPPPKKPRPPKAAARPAQPAAPSAAYDWGYRLEVQIELLEPVVVAFVLAKGGREIAQRSWVLGEAGIAVACICEKGRACRANGLLLKPEHAAGIDEQIEAEIAALRSEYHVPAGRMTVRGMLHGNWTRLPKLKLRGHWKDDDFLGGARATFLAEQLRDQPEDFTPIKFPDWVLALDSAEKQAHLSDADRFVQIACGWLFYEGALPVDELAGLTASVAQPGAWYTPERARDIFRAEPRFKHVRGNVVTLPGVEHPLIVLKEKAARRLPPRAFTAEELLAAGEGTLPLTPREAEIERELNKHAPDKLHLRSIQGAFRNADMPTKVLTALLDLCEPRDIADVNRVGSLLMEIWNDTPRYELRGRTPAEVASLRPNL